MVWWVAIFSYFFLKDGITADGATGSSKKMQQHTHLQPTFLPSRICRQRYVNCKTGAVAEAHEIMGHF